MENETSGLLLAGLGPTEMVFSTFLLFIPPPCIPKWVCFDAAEAAPDPFPTSGKWLSRIGFAPLMCLKVPSVIDLHVTPRHTRAFSIQMVSRTKQWKPRLGNRSDCQIKAPHSWN